MNREITTFLFYSLSKNVLPTFDIAKRKRLFSITASPPNGQFHGWKTPPETFMNRYFRIAGTFSPDFLSHVPSALPHHIFYFTGMKRLSMENHLLSSYLLIEAH